MIGCEVVPIIITWRFIGTSIYQKYQILILLYLLFPVVIATALLRLSFV
jgi:hypothetical protein